MSVISRNEIEAGSYFVKFNQDCSSLSVGCKQGYFLYSITNNIDETLETIYTCYSDEVCMVERLFSSSLVAIVSLNSPRKLKVNHFKKGTEICNYSYSNTILAVKLNRTRLVVCLEESLYIHNIKDMRVVHTIRDTPHNPNGICALAADSDRCYLAYPGRANVGEIQIFDCVNLNAKTMIPAHESSLAALAFSPNGREIASASEKGTVIRVFNVEDGSKLIEFRRGLRRCVNITSIQFSPDANYLVSSSNTETIHVFDFEREKLREQREEKEKKAAKSSGGWLSSFIGTAVSGYVGSVYDVITQTRDSWYCNPPVPGIKHSCTVIKIEDNKLRLLVASQDGFLYVYELPPQDKGSMRANGKADCEPGDDERRARLIKTHDLRKSKPVSILPNVRDSTPAVVVPTRNSPPLSGPSYASAVKTGNSADD